MGDEQNEAVKKWQNTPSIHKKGSKKRVSYYKKKVTQFSSHLSSFCHGSEQKLTKTEQEIVYCLHVDKLTPKEISVRRQTSLRAVQLIIQNLKEKGVMDENAKILRSFASTCEDFVKIEADSSLNSSFKDEHLIRLHGEEWRVGILFKNEKYEVIRSKSNFLDFEDNTIKLGKDAIEIYIGKSFLAVDVDRATRKSFDYFNALLIKLEYHLKVLLKKPRVDNIKRVNAHYSEINNELAKDCEIKGERIKISTDDDNKLWFIIDNSFNLHEAETIHPETSKEDMGNTIQPYFNDLRNKEHYLPSESKEHLDKVDERISRLVDVASSNEKRQEFYNENIVTHTGSIKELGSGVTTMNHILGDMKQVLEKLDSKVSPKPLPDKEAKLLRVKALKEEWW
jgi:hypothetical protein